MKQRFKSKKSSVFIVIVAVVFLLRIISSLNNFTMDDADSRTWEYSGDVLEVVLMIIFSVMVIFRSVEIDGKILKLRSGFSAKKVDIDTVRSLKTIKKNNFVYGDTQVVIQYNKYDEIIFNPADRDSFIQAVLAIKPEITVIKS